MSGEKNTGVFTTDGALVVRSWDAWMAEATGLAEAAACGRTLLELFPDLAERGMIARLRRVADGGGVEVLAPAFHRYLIPCAPREESAHYARMQQHVTIAPLMMGEAVVGVTVTIEDVTARLDRERELSAQLRSPDDQVRLHAARALGLQGSVAPLASALGDESWKVRRAAAEGMGRGGAEAVDTLVAAIRDRNRDPAVLNAALTALTHLRWDVAPVLIDLLDAPGSDVEVRTYTALALGMLEDPRAVPRLVALLGDADANVRFHAIEALGRIGSREGADAVAAVAETRDFSVAFAALDTLAVIGEPSVAPRIIPLLDDPLLQSAAAEALGRLGNEDVVAPLAALLADRDAAAVAAGALAMLASRVDPDYGEGSAVGELTRSVAPAGAAATLIIALHAASDAELPGLVTALGWLAGEGVDEALATMLERPGVRRIAAEVLSRRGAAAVPPLVGALAVDDEETRKAAAAALGRVGNAGAVPSLIALLDGSPDVAVVAAGALGGIGDQRAFEPLIAQLGSPHAAVRQAVVAALNSIGHASMPGRTAALLAHSSPRVREGAARIAGYFGYAECTDALIALCEDEDEAVQRTAVEQLAHVDDPRALGAMTAALERGTAGVRAAAARALAHLPATDALPRLRAAFGDSDPWVRYHAARSAGHHRSAEVAPALVDLATSDPVPPVRIAAAESLGGIGAPGAAGALELLADDEDRAVANAALAALGQIPSATTPDALLAALRSGDGERRRAALAALGRRGDAYAVNDIASLAKESTDHAERAAAMDALARIGGEQAVRALIALTGDPRRSAPAVAALARLDASQLEHVARGLHDGNVGVRCAVVEALARMRKRAASPLLVEALRDPSPAVRLAAAQALGRLDVRDAEAGLAAVASSDSDAAVRRAAQRALAR